jgi:cytochrome c oxidase cbb3-type subunit I/II
MLLRVVGGGLYLVGFLVMGWNVWRSVRGAKAVNGTIEVFVEPPAEAMGVGRTFFNAPVVFTVIGLFAACVWMFTDGWLNLVGLVFTGFVVLLAIGHFESRGKDWADWYDRLLVNALPFTVLTFLAVVAGGLIQIIPMLTIKRSLQTEDRTARVYSPLELAGRDLYVREGCYNCHSQMIRTLVPDVMRYGDYSRLGESIWDHPYQWGSKRTGPDLATSRLAAVIRRRAPPRSARGSALGASAGLLRWPPRRAPWRRTANRATRGARPASARSPSNHGSGCVGSARAAAA